MYKGFEVLLPRCIGILTYYFCVIDIIRRKTNLWNSKTGQFLSSGTAAMTAFWIIWPFEYLKNLAQAENNNLGNTNMERAKSIYKAEGI